MSSDRVDGYAQALLSVARAEGDVDGIRSQLTDVARAVAGNDDLRASLTNNLLPAATRVQIVDDILGGKASDVVRSLVGMIVSAGHGRQLSEIVESFVHASAAASGKRVATVRSAVALSEDQKTRLAHALSASVGGPVELENIVDPEVVGGAVTTIGDTVIDGSLRTRLNQMREAL
ncbi:MAG: ATP synthase F1 subunit delta [Acidimicrobiia bacterium]|nr:ATP synthase F1 subunit delta [Acidimicrobiia bacterium]